MANLRCPDVRSFRIRTPNFGRGKQCEEGLRYFRWLYVFFVVPVAAGAV